MILCVGSMFGWIFCVIMFGELYGGGVGCVVDGVSSRLRVTREEL